MAMHSQFLAQYLLNNRVLSPEQVCEALESAHGNAVELGVLAINQGMMNAEQVNRVRQLQAPQDKLFTEVALSEGFLTEEQVNQLLELHKQSALSFGQTIIDKKFMTPKEFECVLSDAENENHYIPHQALSEMDIDKIDFSEIEDVKDLYSDYIGLFLRTVNHFMDTPAVIVDIKEAVGKVQGTWLISQSMTGDVSISAAIMVPEPVLLEMARRYSGEALVQVDELAVDCVAEFLNMMNGLFAVDLSELNLEIDLNPKKCGKDVLPRGSKVAVVHISTNFGIVQLIVASDSIQ